MVGYIVKLPGTAHPEVNECRRAFPPVYNILQLQWHLIFYSVNMNNFIFKPLEAPIYHQHLLFQPIQSIRKQIQ